MQCINIRVGKLKQHSPPLELTTLNILSATTFLKRHPRHHAPTVSQSFLSLVATTIHVINKTPLQHQNVAAASQPTARAQTVTAAFILAHNIYAGDHASYIELKVVEEVFADGSTSTGAMVYYHVLSCLCPKQTLVVDGISSSPPPMPPAEIA